MKAVAYCRIAPEEEASLNAYAIEVQKSDIEAYSKDHDIEIVEYLVDHAGTGIKEPRPELDRILGGMLEEGVRQEVAWGHYVIGDDIPGLTKGMVTDYIKYLGNLRWAGLGYGTLYEGYDSEPENMAWVSQYSNANMVKTDFFEAKSTAYAKSAAIIDDL